MKRLFGLLLTLALTMPVFAQDAIEVTKFLGIPVDGFKPEMIKKLKAKGFTEDTSEGMLTGEFNGTEVYVTPVTNNNKVFRIGLIDKTSQSERDIIIRFNRLCRQFENNQNYANPIGDQTIPDDEDISYELTVNNKRYEAIFYQKPEDDNIENRMVWFMIMKDLIGKYVIAMCYDNKLNQANGQDL